MSKFQNNSIATSNVACLFEPDSVAIIGTLNESFFGGYVVVNQLQKFGYTGKIYPINPKCTSILGLMAYPTLDAVPGTIDLAVIMTSYRSFPKIIEDCANKGVKAAIIVSDGFAEKDEKGALLQQEIIDIANRANMRLIGPNTIGLTNTANGLMPNPYALEYDKIHPGAIAIYGQTGLVGPQALPLEDMHYGISKICDVGNKCDVDESDFLEYLKNDPSTEVVAMHIEDVKDGRRFIDKAREVVAIKPVLALKPGREKESAKAMASHTGSMAGDDKIYDAAFKQSGIIRVDSHVELLEYAKMFTCNRTLPTGNRVAIISFTGGFGVMGVDAAINAGLSLAEYTPQTKEKLYNIFPNLVNNPTDLGPAFPVVQDFDGLYTGVLDAAINDDNVDCIAIVTFIGLGMKSLHIFSDILEKTSKPMALWVYSQQLPVKAEFISDLEKIGFPVYSKWEHALGALGAIYKYSTIKTKFNSN